MSTQVGGRLTDFTETIAKPWKPNSSTRLEEQRDEHYILLSLSCC